MWLWKTVLPMVAVVTPGMNRLISRSSCAVALGLLGVRTVVYPLLDYLGKTPISQDILFYIIQSLGDLGEHNSVDKQAIAARLVNILGLRDLDRFKGQHIVKLLCVLGEASSVSCLLDLLEDPRIDNYIRKSIAEAIAQLTHDEHSQSRLSCILEKTEIRDDVFRALWAVSRQVTARGPYAHNSSP